MEPQLRVTVSQKILEEEFLALESGNYPRLKGISSKGAIFECKLPSILSSGAYIMTIDGPTIYKDCYNYSVRCTVPFNELNMNEKPVENITPSFALKYAVFTLDNKSIRYGKASSFINRIIDTYSPEQVYVHY
jgi:hypothetical protein